MKRLPPAMVLVFFAAAVWAQERKVKGIIRESQGDMSIFHLPVESPGVRLYNG